jgi:hypothetical protein
MKKKLLFSIILICLNLNVFAGWSEGSMHDNNGNHYNFNTYRSNDLIEYDQYKQQQQRNIQMQENCAALGALIGYGIEAIINEIATSNKDKKVGEILRDYSFKKHFQYMTQLTDENILNKKHNKPVISLFDCYKNYRIDLDKNYLKLIHKVKKPKIIFWEQDLDLSNSPYMNNSKIEYWVKKNYKNTCDQEYVLEKIFEYKQNRVQADQELNNIYFKILKSK